MEERCFLHKREEIESTCVFQQPTSGKQVYHWLIVLDVFIEACEGRIQMVAPIDLTPAIV